jgi:hypothetical protein
MTFQYDDLARLGIASTATRRTPEVSLYRQFVDMKGLHRGELPHSTSLYG